MLVLLNKLTKIKLSFLKKNRHTTNVISSTAREVVAWLAGPAQWAIPR